MGGLVSVLTPTYNCGKYIHRLLDSVLKQNYPSIEMYIIDDGSVDDTKTIIQEYSPRFANRGYTLHYSYQENQGQSVAINNGLKLINGDYLVWPDADDFYKTDDAIEVLVKLLEDADETVGMSRCLLEYLREDDLTLQRAINPKQNYSESLFKDCLYGAIDYWYSPGGYMVKTAVLRQVIPDLEIYTEHDAGQNWQLMLPVLYSYRCVTVNRVMYSVLVRDSSHSRGQYSSRKRSNKRINGYRNTILSTLRRINAMPAAEQRAYAKKINRLYNRKILQNNFSFMPGQIQSVIRSTMKFFKR